LHKITIFVRLNKQVIVVLFSFIIGNDVVVK